jgi:hypothetical protein
VILTFAPASIPGNNGVSTLNIQTGSSAAPGSYTLAPSATGGGVTSTASITLNIGQLAVVPQSAAITVKHGSSASLIVNTSVTGTYNGSVTLSAAGLPKGVTAAFSPAAISNPAAGASTLKFTAATSAAIGTVPVTLIAASDGLTRSTTISLTVQ